MGFLEVPYIPEANRNDKPVYLNGDIKSSFIRKGACDVKCSGEELKRLLNDASIQRWRSPMAKSVAKLQNIRVYWWFLLMLPQHFQRLKPCGPGGG
ncbi:MAG: hypothetical protein B0D92_03325 [Spirochaeta sp. LUC14_002_19_P3]|nr:MAG: hypothetical protein B0D92_03325 [Spirochaeta sp. LUC14_002_19_P3]